SALRFAISAAFSTRTRQWPALSGKQKRKRTMKTLRNSRVSPVSLSDGDFKRHLLTILTSMRDGDFSASLPAYCTGQEGKIADTFNELAARTELFVQNLMRLRNDVGRRGRIAERMPVENAVGGWAERVEAVNSLVDDLSQPTVEMARVI